MANIRQRFSINILVSSCIFINSIVQILRNTFSTTATLFNIFFKCFRLRILLKQLRKIFVVVITLSIVTHNRFRALYWTGLGFQLQNRNASEFGVPTRQNISILNYVMYV